MKQQKYKLLGSLSLTLIGGSALVSIPALITSCKKTDASNLTIANAGIKLSIDINNKSVATWNTGFECGFVDVSKWKKPKDFREGFVNGLGHILVTSTGTMHNLFMIGEFYTTVNGVWISRISTQVPIQLLTSGEAGLTCTGYFTLGIGYTDINNVSHTYKAETVVFKDITIAP